MTTLPPRGQADGNMQLATRRRMRPLQGLPATVHRHAAFARLGKPNQHRGLVKNEPMPSRPRKLMRFVPPVNHYSGESRADGQCVIKGGFAVQAAACAMGYD